MADIVSITSHKGHLLGIDNLGNLHTPAILISKAYTHGSVMVWRSLSLEEIKSMGLLKVYKKKISRKSKRALSASAKVL